MRVGCRFLFVVVFVFSVTGLSRPGVGAVTWSGDIDPDDPTTWTFYSTSAYVGKTSEGSVTVDSSSTIESNHCYLGYEETATGQMTVTGAGSWAVWDFLFVGECGSGTLSIIDGGEVFNRYAFLGFESGSTGVVSVDGAGSTWSMYDSSDFNVGRQGSGVLNITNGGAVSNSYFLGSYVFLGYESGSTGVVTVDGAGSTWTMSDSSNLHVGRQGSGTLNITNGGAVSNYSGHIDAYSGATGVVTVDGAGSTWTNSDDVSVGSYGSGTLNITNGGAVSIRGTLTIDYDLDGDGFLNMSTGGMLVLYGNADDSLAEFLDLIDGTDAIRYWDDSISDWSDITEATPGIDYTLAYIDDEENDLFGYTLLTVGTAPVSIPGDLDGDGYVGSADLDIVRGNWNQSVTPGDLASGDPSGDGMVGSADLDIVRGNWAQGTPPSAAVPEPSVFAGLLVLLFAPLCGRKYR